VKILSRRFFLNSSLARSKVPGITELGFETAYLPYCPFVKAMLIGCNAIGRAETHPPIAMDV
jgi:hypothetical protein